MKLVTKQITNDLSSDNKNVFELSLDLCFWWKDIIWGIALGREHQWAGSTTQTSYPDVPST